MVLVVWGLPEDVHSSTLFSAFSALVCEVHYRVVVASTPYCSTCTSTPSAQQRTPVRHPLSPVWRKCTENLMELGMNDDRQIHGHRIFNEWYEHLSHQIIITWIPVSFFYFHHFFRIFQIFASTLRSTIDDVRVDTASSESFTTNDRFSFRILLLHYLCTTHTSHTIHTIIIQT